MATNIKARRLLSDLFKEGTEVRFWKGEDGPTGKIGPFVDEKTGKKIPVKEGKEVAMFIRPPDPVQRDMAIRSAQAKRAAAMVKAKRDEDSAEHLTIMAFLADMSDETLIDYVVIGDIAERRQEAEREVLSRDEWKDMTQYQDAMRQFLDKPAEELEGNEEYEALLELDKKFGDQIIARETELAEAQREALRFLDRSVVEKKALSKRAEMVGSQAFMDEYEKQMMFYSIRDPDDDSKLFFEKVDEVASQPDPVRELIEEALLPYISDSGEAKNLSRAVSGSASSELPDSQETSDSSTREEQTA
jgi:hypothetical protein